MNSKETLNLIEYTADLLSKMTEAQAQTAWTRQTEKRSQRAASPVARFEAAIQGEVSKGEDYAAAVLKVSQAKPELYEAWARNRGGGAE